MSEEKRGKTPVFHTIYTFAYLPLSLVAAAFIGIGRTSYIMHSVSLGSIMGWIDAIHAIYPLLCALLALITMPLLMAKSEKGRKLVLFSCTLKALLILPMVWSFLTYVRVFEAAIYTLLVFALAFLYAYYRKVSFIVVPASASASPLVEEEKEEEAEEEKSEAEEEAATEEEEPSETEKETEEEEEETPSEMEIPEEITIEEIETIDYDEKDVVKITAIHPSFFLPELPVIVEEVKLITLPLSTLLSITLRNRSLYEYSSSRWTTAEGKVFISEKTIRAGERETISAVINVPTDRVSIALSSLTVAGGKEKECSSSIPVALPEKKELSSLDASEDFSFFLQDYLKKEGEEGAEWVCSENATKSAWLCPRCGLPVLNDEESCPICSMGREKAELFSAKAIQEAFEKARE